MKTWTAHAWLTAHPEDVLAMLTEPGAIARWSPIPFELVDLDSERLESGSRARVRGALAGRQLEFDVDVLEVSEDCLALVAIGPIDIEVEYWVTALDCGTELNATVSISGQGLLGKLCARAAEALLATGALKHAVSQIGRQLQPALA